MMMKKAKSKAVSPGPGRPRSFDEPSALEAALDVFWEKGFEATSLDDLTAAMGVSRSTFYATFGNKQDLFIRALKDYSAKGLSRLRAAADEPADDRLANLLVAVADPDGGRKGCMLVNCVTELAPHDPDVAQIGRKHLEEVAKVFANVIAPDAPETVMDKANAYSSLAIGTIALKKAGVPPEQIFQTLKEARRVLPE